MNNKELEGVAQNFASYVPLIENGNELYMIIA